MESYGEPVMESKEGYKPLLKLLQSCKVRVHPLAQIYNSGET